MKRTVILIQLLTLIFFACSPEDGQDGAMGPQGEQGLTGPQGSAGQDGEDGQDGQQGEQGERGTANVIYSDWFPSKFPDDIAGANYVFSVSEPNLTQEIVDKGVLLGYAKYTSSSDIGVVEQLPFHDAISKIYTISFTVPPAPNSERVFIVVRSTDGSPVGSTLFEEYRYVIIPGGVPTSGKSSIDYTQLSYDEILDLFNIPE